MPTRNQLVNALVEYIDTDDDPKTIVGDVLDGLEAEMESILKDSGEFLMPGLFKVVTKKKPAVKKGTPVYNPFTKETTKSKGKPASMRVMVRPMTRLKAMVN